MPQETIYTARFAYPDDIQREADNTIELPIYHDGALVTPTSGTVIVSDGSADHIVDDLAVTITSGVATYNITAATLPSTLPLSDGWLEVWTLVIEGKTYVFNRPAALVRTRLYPVVTDQDMLDDFTELRRWLADDKSDLQHYIDSAWKDITVRLLEDGRRPYLILSPYSLRPSHMHLTAAKAFRDYAASAHSDGKYWKLYEAEMKEFHKSWDRMTLRYDRDEDGEVTEGTEEGSQPAVFLTEQSGNAGYGRGRWPYYRGGY